MPPIKPVGDMTQAELARFVQRAVYNSPANLPTSLTGEELEATSVLRVLDRIELSDQAVAYLRTKLGL